MTHTRNVTEEQRNWGTSKQATHYASVTPKSKELKADFHSISLRLGEGGGGHTKERRNERRKKRKKGTLVRRLNMHYGRGATAAATAA